MGTSKGESQVEWEPIEVKDIPASPKATPQATQDVLDMLGRIEPGKAIKVTPQPGKTVKGMRIGIGRIISEQEKKGNNEFSSYTVTGDEKFVYIARAATTKK